jgi:hypothetical protein
MMNLDPHGPMVLNAPPVLPFIPITIENHSMFKLELLLKTSQKMIKIKSLPVHTVEIRSLRTPLSKRFVPYFVGLFKLRCRTMKDNF